MSLGMAVGPIGQQALSSGPFNPQTAITWHSLFWAEGSDFVAQGYSDAATVGTWPNETTEKDATEATDKPTYRASDATLGSRPAVDFAASNTKLTTAAFTSNPTYPISIVLIGYMANSGTFRFAFSGLNGSTRNEIFRNNTNWAVFAGTGTVASAVASDGNKHLFVASFDGSTGSETLAVDNTSIATGNAGSATLTGLAIGRRYDNSFYWGGAIALLGIYSGDITAHGQWANFKTWVTSHYGITLA